MEYVPKIPEALKAFGFVFVVNLMYEWWMFVWILSIEINSGYVWQKKPLKMITFIELAGMYWVHFDAIAQTENQPENC